MTAVAVQRNIEHQRPREHNQNLPSQPSNRRQNPNHRQTSSGPSQQYAQTTTPPSAARFQDATTDGVVRTSSSRVAKRESRNSRSANGASATNTPDIMPAQNADGGAGRATNGAPQRRIDTIMGGNITAGRRNQSSATLSNGNKPNGKTNGETVVAKRPGQLQRSKSDYGPRGEEPVQQEEEEDGHDWGARHGFDGHYASDDFVIQLANVSSSFLPFSSLPWSDLAPSPNSVVTMPSTTPTSSARTQLPASWTRQTQIQI